VQPRSVTDDRVRGELATILESRTFAGAVRSSGLLKFLVEAVLDGRAHYLKEYTLGAEALGRGPDFDPRADPIARVEASRLRSRLELYYATEGAANEVVIAVPKGGYIPEFTERPQAPPSETAPRPAVGWRVALGLAAAVLGAAGLGLYRSFSMARGAAATPLQALQPLISVDAALGAPGTVAMLVGSSVGFTPDGETLVFLMLRADGGTSLFARRLDRFAATEIPGTFGSGGGFFFSPDSRWVAFFADGELKKTLIDGGGSPVTLAAAGDMLGGTWSENGRIIAALNRESMLWTVPEDGGTPAPIVDLSAAGIQPRWPQLLPGGRAVIYSAVVGIGSGNGIAVAELDTGTVKTLVPTGTQGRYVPSGHLVYLDRGTLFAVEFDLDRLEVHGEPAPVIRDVAFVSDFAFGHFDVGAHGTLAYLRSVASGLSTIELLAGSDVSQPLLAEPGRYQWPRLSPDGRELAYTKLEGTDADLWIYDLAAGTKRRVSVGGGTQSMAVWTPDGRYLVYQEGGRPAMFSRRSDGTGATLELVPGISVPWSITADGRRLAYSYMSSDTGFDLYTAPLEDSPAGLRLGTPEVFRALQTYETYPSFSPDGRFISHGSNESGSWEIYVRAYPDDGSAVRVSTAGGRMSMWSKNRSELYYETLDLRMMVVPYRIVNDAFVAAPARQWSDKRLADTGVIANYDVTADGKVVALLPSGSEGQAPRDHLTLAVNFFDELRRQAP